MKKLCGCKKNLIDITETRCKDCQAKYGKDRIRTLSKNESFYKTNRWRKLSYLVKNKFNGLDVYELKVNHRLVKAKVVHHIIPVNDDETRKFDIKNLIPLSIKTHMLIEQIYKTKDKEKMQKLLFSLIQNEY